MNEKAYHVISATAIWNLVLGIITLVTGVASGVMLIINAVRLLKTRREEIF